MELRGYQETAMEALYEAIREREGNPVLVLPTGAGKGVCLAKLAQDTVGWGGRLLILAHVHELLSQTAGNLKAMAPEIDVGIWSAGLGEKRGHTPVVIAGVQSAYRKAEALGHFDIVAVDEVHRVPDDGDGQYRTMLAGLKAINPAVRLVGLTATPFRLGSGNICGPDNLFNFIAHEVSVTELIRQGFLCNLISKGSRNEPDVAKLHVRAGEYVAEEAEAMMNDPDLVRVTCQDILERAKDRKSVLIFCAGVEHAKNIFGHLDGIDRAACVFGDTPKDERAAAVRDFRSGALRYLVNVGVYTTGFDAPNVGCVALVRPTASPGLYSQMCGRGFRIHPSKQNCLILDYGGNILRHGPLDRISVEDRMKQARGQAPWKKCPECEEILPAAVKECYACGYVFPVHAKEHDTEASDAPILAGQVVTKVEAVTGVYYDIHNSNRGTRTMRVDYTLGDGEGNLGDNEQSEWICLEHDGYAREKACRWWARRSLAPVPSSVEEGVALAKAGALAETKSITIRRVGGEKFPSIVSHVLGPKPATWTEPQKEPANERFDKHVGY